MHRLPFNLYLRVAHEDWAPKHQAELRPLQMIEEYTHVPVPQGKDAIQHLGPSYLLMTGLHGCGTGQKPSTMTDEQLEIAAIDLKEYITELRHISNNTESQFHICIPLGGGILN
jgi:hypothetical protein